MIENGYYTAENFGGIDYDDDFEQMLASGIATVADYGEFWCASNDDDNQGLALDDLSLAMAC